MNHAQCDVRLHRPATDSWLSVLIFIDNLPDEDHPSFRRKFTTGIDSVVDAFFPKFEVVAYRIISPCDWKKLY